MADLSAPVRDLVSRYFPVTEDTFIRDMKPSYPELRVDALDWVVDGASGRSLMIATMHGSPIVLSDLNHAALNTMISPAAGEADDRFEQALDLFKLIYDPRFLLCDSAFADQPEFIVDSYTAPGGGTVAELLSLCTEPEVTATPDAATRYVFRILDFSGAVREVTVSIADTSPPQITHASVAALTMEGRFYFADEV